MSTTTASPNNLYRLGGIAAIRSSDHAWRRYPARARRIGVLVMAAYYFALYRAESSALNLIATLSAVGGGILALFTAATPNHLYNVAFAAGAYSAAFVRSDCFNGKADFPRVLAITGIVGGVFGLLNLWSWQSAAAITRTRTTLPLTSLVYVTYLPRHVSRTGVVGLGRHPPVPQGVSTW